MEQSAAQGGAAGGNPATLAPPEQRASAHRARRQPRKTGQPTWIEIAVPSSSSQESVSQARCDLCRGATQNNVVEIRQVEKGLHRRGTPPNRFQSKGEKERP